MRKKPLIFGVENKTSKYSIRRLPSGFWCVWYGSDWVEASFISRKDAEEFVQDKEKGAK